MAEIFEISFFFFFSEFCEIKFWIRMEVKVYVSVMGRKECTISRIKTDCG